MMAPGSGFYSNPDDGRQQVRIAYILNKEDLSKAVLVLRKALEAYNAQMLGADFNLTNMP